MKIFPGTRSFLFRCRHLFRGVPVALQGEPFRLDESLRRWDLDSECAFQRALREHLRPGDVVFDIGANFGMHSLYAARLVSTAGRVYAFEPIPANLRLLHCHLRLNRLEDRVTVVPKAVSDSREPVLEMYLPAEPLAVTASLRPASGSAAVTRVPNVRLDDFACADAPRLRCVKIDVEGAELEVVRGAANLLRRTRPLLLIEVHGFALPHFGASVEQLRSFLADLGYSEKVLEAPQFRGQEYYQSLFQPCAATGGGPRGSA